MNQSLEDIYADIMAQYGPRKQERNVEFIKSLIQQRIRPDGTLDDNIPVPTPASAAKFIILIVDYPELSWESICENPTMKQTMEYLFIRARTHYPEVKVFVRSLLRQHAEGISSQTIDIFINTLDYAFHHRAPTRFSSTIPFPEHAEDILRTLHFLLDSVNGKDAALILQCAREEGLSRDISHAIIVTEFPKIQKAAYNKYWKVIFTKEEKQPILTTLRTRIGYSRNEDGSISFSKSQEPTRAQFFYQFWHWMESFSK